MKKYFLSFTICILLLFMISGCGPNYTEAAPENPESANEDNYFTSIIEWREDGVNYCLKYANNTKVVYITAESGHRYAITAVLNPDGTPQLYDENFRY